MTAGAPRDRLADLDPSDVDPIELFRRWLDEALASENREPTAMTLATVDDARRPTARVVLLKGLDASGLRFFTNYHSRKGRELAGSPWVSLVFFWQELGYQVRIRGRAERVPEAESDEYFASRPHGSQVGAWASDQSRPVGDRADLVARLREVEERFAGADVPRPAHWGGYRVAPDEIEFWQEGEFRLHDRIRFERRDAGWLATRLFP